MLFLFFSSAEYADVNKQILTTSLTRHCKYLCLNVSSWYIYLAI